MFVLVNGTQFELDGERFRVNGANCYYAAFASDPMVESVLEVCATMRFNVLRTWAFFDVAGPVESPWFQCGPGQFNDGPNGLELLDRTIEIAERFGIRLLLPLVNHWDDFGGVKQYARWLGLARGEDFYSDKRALDAYRRWVEHIILRVNSRTGRRYSDEPSILAWELANEPRCEIPGGREILLNWAEQMSTFVKQLDANHMVALGDEGFFHRDLAGRHHAYDGSHGVDWDALLRIAALDFGTCHLYPSYEPASAPGGFGARWIAEHSRAGEAARKPSLIEEYGVASKQDNNVNYITERDSVFEQWWNAIDQSGGAGALLWMVAGIGYDGNLYPDYDGYTVYGSTQAPSVVRRT